MTASLYVPVEEIMAETGLTRIQVAKDIKAGLLPGMIVRRKPRVLRADWDAYKTGEWRPRTAPASFLREIKTGVA